MALGVPVREYSTDDATQKIRKSVIGKVKRIVAKYGLDDENWAEAISSQYFLLCLAQDLNLKKQDYENLIDKCLVPFRVTHKSELVLDSDKILITPSETNRILDCMQHEDDSDPYFTFSAKMQAKNIDPQVMYQNFHFGLLVRNASTEDTEILNKVKVFCLDKLTDSKVIDTSGGWYPYRVPWITGRILISLRNVDFSSYGRSEKLNGIISDAIDSLYQRINENASYWRSGVGNWVTNWESTALCLEALFVWEQIQSHEKEIKKILDYLFSNEVVEKLFPSNIDFSTEAAANDVLSAVTLGSVLYRVTRAHYADIFENKSNDIIKFFEKVVNAINKQEVAKVEQYCTIPQILHYVVVALK